MVIGRRLICAIILLQLSLVGAIGVRSNVLGEIPMSDETARLSSYEYVEKLLPILSSDTKKAIKCLDKIATYNSSAALLLGDIYRKGEYGEKIDVARAIGYYQIAEGMNNVDAMCSLGIIYLDAEGGIARNVTKGLEYLTKSAEKGCVTAQANLGFFYENGMKEYGMAADPEKSYKYSEMAAQQGHRYSLFTVGRYCFEGVVTEKNEEKGLDYLLKAAEAGSIKAYNYLKEHADAGNSSCCLLMADILENGRCGQIKNSTKSAEYRKLAEENGD